MSELQKEAGGLVERLRGRAESYRMGGPLSEHTAAILDEAASALASERAAHAETKRERDAVIEAMTPSAQTKAAYIGEFYEELDVINPNLDDEDEPETISQRIPVSWTTIKEVMAAISSRAARRVREGGKKDG